MTECYFCDSTESIEEHHILPKRFDGSDADVNTVNVCHDCHWKLERLYNSDFWEALGIDDPRATKESHIRCHINGCNEQAEHTVHLSNGKVARRCAEHYEQPRSADGLRIHSNDS
jgi:hypothetical protein